MSFLEATIGAALVMAGVASTAGEPPSCPSADPAAFLHRMAGEWSVVADAILGPDGQWFEFARADYRRGG